MSNEKLKVLWVGEATFLSTGYATYGREVLSRLHKTGKYEIAEFAIFGSPLDIRRHDIEWTYYGNTPEDNKMGEEYDSQQANKFGAWRFDSVVLDFKPDVVISISDWWMFEYIERSPFRRFFSWIVMPAVDSTPQPAQWISTYLSANALLAYCEFGKQEIDVFTGLPSKVLALAPPSADYSIFCPIKDKTEMRNKLGIMPNLNIIGRS